jgi:septal ring factor EnvC (AmiA/AmiB activator)
MEPGTILRTFATSPIFEKMMKSKQIIESAYEKSLQKITYLKKSLVQEKEQNNLFRKQIAKMNELEEKFKNSQNEVEAKNREIVSLNEKLKNIEKNSEGSDSDTWRQLYESTKYSKLSSRTDYLELSNSIQRLLDSYSDSQYLKPLLKKRKSKLQEMRNLSSTLNFERLLFHICELSQEILIYIEDHISPQDSDHYLSYKFHN